MTIKELIKQLLDAADESRKGLDAEVQIDASHITEVDNVSVNNTMGTIILS